jgi:hypothetical protein
MESELTKFVNNPNNKKIDETLTFIVTFIVKIIKIALGYALNYINYFILSGLFLIYFAIFAAGLNSFKAGEELFLSIFKFLSIFFPIDLNYGAETPISVLIQILFLTSSIITLLILLIKFIIKKIFKVSINISFAKELLIKLGLNTIIWSVLLIISQYINMGNGVFAFYIITSILIIISMILGHLSKVILKSTTKTIEVSVVQ